MYYSYNKLWSYDKALFYFLIGERGVGKSYGAKKHVINDYLKNGNQFVYLRRYKTELDSAVPTFFNDIVENNEFGENYVFKAKKSKQLSTFECNGEVMGYAVALSTANILKSTSFAKVKTIIFDEFIIDKGNYHYLSGGSEVTQLLDLVETIGRLRDIKVLFLGNAISSYNPYFAYFDIRPDENVEFKTYKDGLIVLNYIKNEEYRAVKKTSKFGRLIANSSYGDYAIGNQWLRDNNNFIEEKSKNAKFWFLLTIDGENIGVWRDGATGAMYLSEKYDPSTKFILATTANDHNIHTKFISLRTSPFGRIITDAFKDGALFFENQRIKGRMMNVFNKAWIF